MNETTFDNILIKYYQKKYGYAIKMHGSKYMKDKPDIFISCGGTLIAIETKVFRLPKRQSTKVKFKSKLVTKGQQAELREISNSGAIALVASLCLDNNGIIWEFIEDLKDIAVVPVNTSSDHHFWSEIILSPVPFEIYPHLDQYKK